MTYNELLAQKEWWSKCNEILSRDHFTCQDCGSVGFHNDYSFATIDDICVIDNILSSWEIDGNRITHFCSSIMNYNLEHFEGVELREAEPFSQNNVVGGTGTWV